MPNWTSGGEGAVGGALGGAQLGSMFGPAGTAIGGIAGGLLGGAGGLFGGGESEDQKRNKQMLMDYYNQVQGRQAPQMGPAAQGAYSDFRGNQRNLISRLEAMSKGQGPSLAAEQLKQATDRNMSQQAGIAASGRGGPLAAQQAANNMALQGSQAAQIGTQARIQEQMQALDRLGLNIHGAREADEGMNRFNAGQTNDVAAQNLMARLKTMGMNDDAIMNVMAQMNGNANGMANKPSMGDQLLAGGAGLFSMGATQRAGKGGATGAVQGLGAPSSLRSSSAPSGPYTGSYAGPGAGGMSPIKY